MFPVYGSLWNVIENQLSPQNMPVILKLPLVWSDSLLGTSVSGNLQEVSDGMLLSETAGVRTCLLSEMQSFINIGRGHDPPTQASMEEIKWLSLQVHI